MTTVPSWVGSAGGHRTGGASGSCTPWSCGATVKAGASEARSFGTSSGWSSRRDTDDRTSLSGVDLYEDLPGKLAAFENHGGHQIAFYQRFGYVLVGVMPDSGGVGKPDIFLAKRIGR